jgi:hypothetical protein
MRVKHKIVLHFSEKLSSDSKCTSYDTLAKENKILTLLFFLIESCFHCVSYFNLYPLIERKTPFSRLLIRVWPKFCRRLEYSQFLTVVYYGGCFSGNPSS